MFVPRINLPTATSWQAAHPPEHYISSAPFAILRKGTAPNIAGVVDLVVGEGFTPDSYRLFSIAYAGYEGLYYSSDSNITYAQLGELVANDEADVTEIWAHAEDYLVKEEKRTQKL